MTGRQIRVVRRIEGDKLITEQRDKSTGNIFFIVENFVDSDGHMIEVISNLLSQKFIYLKLFFE